MIGDIEALITYARKEIMRSDLRALFPPLLCPLNQPQQIDCVDIV